MKEKREREERPEIVQRGKINRVKEMGKKREKKDQN